MGQFSNKWLLKGGNGEILCHSEVNTTKQSAERGAETAKRIAPAASVIDRT
ncbi:YegP family protein [Agrobacterium sp. ES01]|uniref:YegP family protein n=1 Tax=Agrobacterium sp. ES01 TaxID=3420714 RepID=UPI003D0BC921